MLGYNDLVKTLREVHRTGIIDAHIEKVCDYQDMIGHSSFEQLKELATEYKESFYRLYCTACGVTETLRFYFENSDAINRLREQVADKDADLDDLRRKLAEAEKVRDHFIGEHREAVNGWTTRTAELKTANDEIEELKRQNMELKAKLYDIMMQA